MWTKAFRLGLQSGPAIALTMLAVQGPAAADESQGIESIIVTAQRREELLQNTPVSVTAFTTAELSRRQIVDVHSLLNATPSTTFTASSIGKNNMVVAIRGVAPGTSTSNVDQATATYVDGFYYARPEMSNFAMVDLARVEVLRGPQGTLFGRNSIGGVLNIVTNEPTDRFEGSASLSYGNFNTVNATGIVNVPLSESWAARLVYSHVNHDGYARTAVLNASVDDQDDDFFRVTLRGEVVPAIKSQISFDYTHSSVHPPLWILNYLDPTRASPSLVALLTPSLNTTQKRVSATEFDPLNRSRAYDVTAKFIGDLGWGTLTSITGYRNMDYNAASSLSGANVQVTDVVQANTKGDQISEELQLAGDSLGDKLHWLAGFYYFTEDIDNILVPATLSSINNTTILVDNTSTSAFGQVTYEVAPALRVTGGVRYVHDKRAITYVSPHYALSGPLGAGGAGTPESRVRGPQLPGNPGCPTFQAGLSAYAPCEYTPSPISFDYVPWTVGIDYKATDTTLLYMKVSRGYRSGGFQGAGGVVNGYYRTFGPENLVSYEGGAKLSLFNNNLTLSSAAYHAIYDKMQQINIQIISGQPVTQVLNAGAASINGFELEVNALLENLRLNGSVGIINPRFTEGPYKGSPLPTVAKLTYSISGDYPIDLAAGTLTLHANYNHKSNVNFLNTINIATGQSYTPAQIASISQKGYGLLDAKVSFELKTMPVTVALWGKNLTGTFYAQRTGNFVSSFFNSTFVGDPRTYGITASYKF